MELLAVMIKISLCCNNIIFFFNSIRVLSLTNCPLITRPCFSFKITPQKPQGNLLDNHAIFGMWEAHTFISYVHNKNLNCTAIKYNRQFTPQTWLLIFSFSQFQPCHAQLFIMPIFLSAPVRLDSTTPLFGFAANLPTTSPISCWDNFRCNWGRDCSFSPWIDPEDFRCCEAILAKYNTSFYSREVYLLK